ncbi:uncharacterized protein LOC114828616 [Galendromus occidentalis]|uniref:Uncharacterized protein LOC114828616 n=1 Tax=Galendromus occidentalis TaxID=34638 RepID=A0AAJ7SI55_9ACAR|nr:uncharacterized protein LOC114828616 [Galendromus occidentalis]
MFFLSCSFLLVAVPTTLVHGGGQEYYGPGLGGMSYHPYPSRSAYIPTRGASPLGPLPVREPPYSKHFQPLLHDFHTPVQKTLGVPQQFPVKETGLTGAYPGHLNPAAGRVHPLSGGLIGIHDAARGFVPQGAFNGLHDPIRSLGPHGAYPGGHQEPIRNVAPHGALGGVPLKDVGAHGAFDGLARPLPPQVKDIDISTASVPNALANKNIALPNPAAGTLTKDTLHSSGFGAYPSQINQDIGYPGHGAFNGPYYPKEALGHFTDQGFTHGFGNEGFGAHGISEPFLTPIGRFSGGYEYQRVPLALVQGRFVGHRFGTPVVHGIVKAGVPVSLARGW